MHVLRFQYGCNDREESQLWFSSINHNSEHYDKFLGVCVGYVLSDFQKKVLFGNYRFVTIKNILKSHQRIYMSMLIWYIIPIANC